MARMLHLLKQLGRIASLLAAAGLALGLGICNLSMVPGLFLHANGIVILLWILAWMLVIFFTLYARTSWRKIVAAHRAKNEDMPKS